MPRAIQRQSYSAVPVTVTSRLSRAWVNDHVHVAAWFTVAATLLALYLSAHYLLRPQYLGSPSVEQSIAAAVHLYFVAEDDAKGRLDLMLEGEPVALRPDDPGPLGIGRLSPARGLLAEARSRLAAYDRRLDAFLRELLTSFTPVEGRAGWMQAPLERFAGRGFEAEEGQVVRIHTGSLRPLIDLEPNEAGARRLLRLLARAEVHDLSVPTPASAASGALEALDPTEAPPGVRESLQQIQREAAQLRIRLGSRRLAQPTSDEIVSAACDELEELRAPIEDFFGDAVAGVPGCAPFDSGNGAFYVDPFHARLASLLVSEVGFFWTLGPWLWLEVVLLAWLGVLTECLTRLGVRYSGVDPDRRRWEPRETGRTLLKLAYAPAIAMVVVLTLMMTDWIETDTRISQGGVAAFVPIAFTLGLFPNLGYALLERLARAVFQETSIARPRPGRKRVITTEHGTPPIPRGAPPDFAAVRERIERHGTAPLRGE